MADWTEQDEAEYQALKAELGDVSQPQLQEQNEAPWYAADGYEGPGIDDQGASEYLKDVAAPFAQMGDMGKLGEAFTSFPGKMWDAGKGLVSEIAGGFPATQKYYNEHGLADTAVKGLGGVARVAGSVATGPFAPITDQFINKGLQRMAPDVFEPTTAEQDAESIRGGIAGAAIVPAALKTVQGTRNVIRSVMPSADEIAYRGAQMEGSSATALNAPKGTTMREGQLVRDIMPKEQVFLNENPAAGINTKGLDGQINAYPQLQQNIARIKETANATKANAIATLDQAGGPGVVITTKNLNPLAVANGLSDDATSFALSKVSNELVDTVPYNQAIHAQYPMQIVGNKPMAFVPKKLTPSQLQDYVRGIDDELRRLGAFDDLQLSKISTDPSYMAQVKPQIDGLFFLRRTMNDELVNYARKIQSQIPGSPNIADDITSSNAKVSAMIEYENLANRYQTDMLQGLTPGSGRSMTGIGGSNPLSRSNALNSATGGAIGELGAKQAAMQSTLAGARAVEALQNWTKYAGGRNMPLEMRLFNNFPNLQTAMGLGAALPRDTRSIDGDASREEMFMNTARSLGIVDPETRYSDLPEAVRKQMLELMVSNTPGAFERTPDGYQGVVNGRFVNPQEKDMHLRSAIDRKLPLEQEAEIVGGLLQENKYVPLDTYRPQTSQLPSPTKEIDSFINDLDIPMFESSPGLFETDPVMQLENLTKSRSKINFERSGL